MQIVERTLTMVGKSTGEFEILPLADMHIGSVSFHETRFLTDIQYIKNTPNCYWIGVGDMTDSIVYQDLKRFSYHGIAPEFRGCLDNLPVKQCEKFIRLVKDIAPKCLGLCRGNHEATILKQHSFDQLDYVCSQLNVPNLQDAAYVVLKTDCGGTHNRYIIYATHGNVAGRKSGGKANRLEDLMGMFLADIYIIGHGHKKIMHTSSQLSVGLRNGKYRLKHDKKIGVMTGSYLKSYEQNTGGYCEAMMMPPSDIGAVRIYLCPRNAKTNLGEIHAKL